MTKISQQILIQEKMSLVINKLISLEEINGSEYTGLTQQEKEKIGYFTRDFGMGHWDWPQGIGLFGLSHLGDQYNFYIKKWANTEIRKGLPTANINTVCPLFTLMDFPEYEELCLEWADKIMDDFDRTKEGGLQHNTTGSTKDTITPYNELIWADTIFMTVLFLGKMGMKYKKHEWIDEAIYQVLLHIKYLLDRETGLFYHAWDFDKKSNFGGNFWCRGNSWLTMGLPLFINMMNEELSYATKKYLTMVYKNQVDGLIVLRDKEEYLWHTMLDDDTSYIEVSGSAGIVAGIYFGLESGLIEDTKYKVVCGESVEKLLDYIDSEGTVQGVSAGTIVGHDKEHYKNIIIKPMAYGQAMMICALGKAINND